MSNFFNLATLRTQATGRTHIVVMRDHGVSVVSERIAALCNYSRII
jgi:hypothetical protein